VRGYPWIGPYSRQYYLYRYALGPTYRRDADGRLEIVAAAVDCGPGHRRFPFAPTSDVLVAPYFTRDDDPEPLDEADPVNVDTTDAHLYPRQRRERGLR
jgi:hypothetical protein